ncbi:DHA2 family efflux MFS transporter permease subunit [Streptomyces sp. NPDC001606]
MSRVEAKPAETDAITPAIWRLAGVIALGAFAGGLDTSLINIALETIQKQFHTGIGTAQWIASGYLLALAVSLPVCAWLGRRVGAGRLYLWALAAFTVISALCGLAPNIESLIVLRVFQGLTAGLLVPTGQTILGQAVGPGRLGRVMARLGIAVTLAPALGPTLGGLMLHNLSWRWLFLINVPLGIIAIALGRRYLPREKGASTTRLDWAGYGYVGVGLPLVVYSLTTWGELGRPDGVRVLLPLVIGVLGLAVFVRHAARRESPLLDMGLFRNPGYVAACAGFAFNGAMSFGSALLFPLYFQLLHTDGVVATGLQMLPLGLGTALTLPLSGRLTDKYTGGPVAVAGASLTALVTAAFALADSPGKVFVQVLLFGLGMGTGLASTPMMVAAFGIVPRDRLPDATAQINILVRLGGALGAALFSVIVARGLSSGPEHAFHTALWWQFGTAVATLLGTLGLWWALRKNPAPTAHPHH